MKNWKNCFGYVFVVLVFYGVVKWLFMGGYCTLVILWARLIGIVSG